MLDCSNVVNLSLIWIIDCAAVGEKGLRWRPVTPVMTYAELEDVR
jgi:hypothetical protein